MSYKIEVVVSDDVSTTDKGKLIENIGCKILLAMQYDVVKEIRITGMEVDLFAKHRINGEEIYVECKAHNSTLSADVLTKILGNVDVKGVSAGWLITTGPLGKDAKGIMEEWEKKTPEKRRRLSIYTNERVIELLKISGNIISDEKLELKIGKTYREESVLLISNYGEFWLKIENVDGSTIAKSITCFNAKEGVKITDISLLTKLKELNTDYQILEWNNLDTKEQSYIEGEIGSVVEVSGGDEWADYRPSRPEDFVGRQHLLEDTIEYFNKVRNKTSNTRLFSITAPSGWGKSSFILRLSDEIFKKKNKSKYFIYAVDVRAAISSRYAEFAIIECFKNAIDKGFISKPSDGLTYSNSSVPFEHESFQEIFKQLDNEEKVIILCFDQFEETFSKKELMNLFENIRRISINVDSIKENLILGFAWKTDVVVPVEHPAYFMWHSLSDRRKNFELTIFSKEEMKKAITIFSKQLDQTVNKILQEYLADQCQGYPWLLKKLCIHVYKLVSSGINQEQIIGQSMNIEDLFQKDLSELSHKENACIIKIANDTPADYYNIHEIFGEDIIKELINKRLVLRKGQKLILYWDIFRDYVLDGKIPKILFYYTPQLPFNKYTEILEYLEKTPVTTIDEFSKSLNISDRTASNVIKDLIMFGNIEKNGLNIKFKQSIRSEAYEKAVLFWKNHILFSIIKDYADSKQKIVIETLKKDFNNIHAYSQIRIKTKDVYFSKILSWLRGLQMVEIIGDLIEITEGKNFESLKTIKGLKRSKYIFRNTEFMGQGTYEKVLELNQIFKNDNLNEKNKKTYRNEINLLNSINFIKRNNDKIELNIDYDNFEIELKKVVKNTIAIKAIHSYVKETDGKLTAKVVGEILMKVTNKNNWKDATVIRNGGAVLRWYRKIC